MNIDRKTLMEYYRRSHISPDSADISSQSYQKDNILLRQQCFTYLLNSVDNLAPRYSEDYQILLGRSCADDKWMPQTTERALKYLEEYALNVFKYPWKREFSSIKLYTGFYCSRVVCYLPEAEEILQKIGYISSPRRLNVLQLCRDAQENNEEVISVAFNLWLLQGECEIITNIYMKIRQQLQDDEGCLGLFHDIHRCRASATTLSSIDECIDAVLRRRRLQTSPPGGRFGLHTSVLPGFSRRPPSPDQLHNNRDQTTIYSSSHHRRSPTRHHNTYQPTSAPTNLSTTRPTSQNGKPSTLPTTPPSSGYTMDTNVADVEEGTQHQHLGSRSPSTMDIQTQRRRRRRRGQPHRCRVCKCTAKAGEALKPSQLHSPCLQAPNSPGGVFTSTPRPYSSTKPVMRRMNSYLAAANATGGGGGGATSTGGTSGVCVGGGDATGGGGGVNPPSHTVNSGVNSTSHKTQHHLVSSVRDIARPEIPAVHNAFKPSHTARTTTHHTQPRTPSPRTVGGDDAQTPNVQEELMDTPTSSRREICLNKTIRPKPRVEFNKQLIMPCYDVISQSTPEKVYDLTNRTKKFSIYDNFETPAFIS